MPFKVRTPEHRQRSAFGNTHAGSHRGQRIPTKQQFAVRHAIHVDMWGALLIDPPEADGNDQGKPTQGSGTQSMLRTLALRDHQQQATCEASGMGCEYECLGRPLSPKRAELAMKCSTRVPRAC
eukprot:TRINITY_DN2159_c0_g1_i5.p1 TRINITY_DN2159_c0_g1~~TRINITY_DN2159_c0_g1_i5.p1  ORF type:complete len:124 (-),score=6.31 TRINITY_DN2159_c0_g1_i5:356-727(-)